MAGIKKGISKIFIILIIGGIGGVLADQFFLPYLATIPYFSKIEFINRTGNGTTIINPTEEIIITENKAIENSFKKIAPCVVSVRSYKSGKLISQGTGFVVTSDGLIITKADLAPAKADKYLIFKNSHSIGAEVNKMDLESNLALLKIEENNLPVVSFIDLDSLNLGERIIITGAEVNNEELTYFLNLGIVRSLKEKEIKINISQENALANGSPLINVKGEVVGLNSVDQEGALDVISVDTIKEFIGL